RPEHDLGAPRATAERVTRRILGPVGLRFNDPDGEPHARSRHDHEGPTEELGRHKFGGTGEERTVEPGAHRPARKRRSFDNGHALMTSAFVSQPR
ncbi:MAG: hypothetical protein QOE25_802, partial [Actinomycetota bacterium]|nr:hypothetical protein [Actinomycetota bacterium]